MLTEPRKHTGYLAPRSPLVKGEVLTPDSQHDSPSPDKGRAEEGFCLKGNTETGARFSSRNAYIPYNTNLRELARQNRKNSTAAEAKIWKELLRIKPFANYKFTRQKPLGSYIADFYCSELRLVIEIDGDSHAENIEYDMERTKFLASIGLSVIRYQNRDVIRNLAGVAEDLSEKISAILQRAGGDS